MNAIWKKWIAAFSAAAMTAVILAGCGSGAAQGGAGSGSAAADGSVDGAALHDMVAEISDGEVPLGQVKAGVLTPTAPGTVTYGNESTTIDASNASQGYVMVKYAAGETRRIKVQLTRSGGTTYTYNLDGDGQYDVFPLSQGNGSYSIKVFRNVSGTQYSQVFGQDISVTLDNDRLPFLYPNQYISFTQDSNAVSLAAQLAAKAEGDELGTVANVYNYVVGNIKYDYDKAKNVESTYLPVVDQVLSSKTGICFDYAALMTAMLRSQGIPTKLIVGYSGSVYHAWISTYISEVGWVNNIISFDGQNWKLMDPTFASTGNSSDKVMDYINNSSNYQEKFCY